ncbi:MAG: GH3 auxin-responsive promoter family protein [Flavobacteriales bacterium]|jgi:hypothetical protein|nr:GH3 auxin-responsive promoter family protein [Flavobacteriales bacterium]
MLLNFSGKIVSLILKHRMNSIEKSVASPQEVQWETWRSLIEAGYETQFGKDHNFEKISSISDYQKLVPIHDYVGLLPYLNKTRKGESNVLWPGKIEWFAKSSGTTDAKSKFIPISQENLLDCHFKCGKDLLSIYLNRFDKEAEIFSGKSLVLGGAHAISEHDFGILEGDLSAIIIENLPIWVSWRRSPSKEVALMEEWEEKLDRMADESIKEDIRTIAGVPSWTTVLLRKVLEKTGKNHILEVWPNLELFMHGGVSFVPYKKDFETLIGGRINYLEIYNASEGFFAIQDIPERDDLLLTLDSGIFYEFVPIEFMHQENPKAYSLKKVKKNQVYAMIISTNSGLWRYNIGDTIEFTSINPYRIKIKGRTKHYINTFGEELMVENAEIALTEVCDELDLRFINFTAGPRIISNGACGYHEWLVEFEENHHKIDPKEVAQKLDIRLQSLNSDYQAKRYKNMVLQPLKINIAQRGLFYHWMKKSGKLGGQHKVPRLSNDPEILDNLLKENSKIHS